MAKKKHDEQEERVGRVLVYTEPETRERLERAAQADDRSLSDYCRRVLRRHVEELDAKGTA